MNIPTRMVEMLLRGKTDQFKTVMKEELEHRTSILMEKLYKSQSDKLFDTIIKNIEEINPQINEIIKKDVSVKFIPESTYYLKDGTLGILNESEKQLISKLYEKLNTDNKERMVKLLSESKESFNRVLNLAKVENKK